MNKVNKVLNLTFSVINQPIKLINNIINSIKEDYSFLENLDKEINE